MKVRIYQINDDRDTNMLMFRNYEFMTETLKLDKVPSESYDKIYDGEVDCKTKEDIYTKFNIDHPEDFRGHSLSVSDVVEIYESNTVKNGFYFCDSVGFREVDFTPELCHTSERFNTPPENLFVIHLQADKLAKVVEVEDDYKAMQKLVGGYMQTISLYDDGVLLVCNDEGKINGSPLNRAIYDETEKEMVEIIAGDCFICGVEGENFASLSPEMTVKYMEIFKYPEMFFRAGKEIKAVPYNPESNSQKLKPEHTSLEDKLNAAEKEANQNKENSGKNNKGREDYTL